VGKLYTSELVSINGTGYTVEIWDNATTPTVKTLLMTGEGFTISRDGEGDKTFENPIRTSRAEATFSITQSADISIFQNMAVSDEGSYHMVIKKGTLLYWAGRILPDQNQWERTPDGVFIMTVTAVDALQLLENYDIDDDWFDSDGRILISKFIYEALKVVGMDLIWDDAGATSSFFADALKIQETTLQSFTTERIGKQKISIKAFYRDFSTFSDYTVKDNVYTGLLVNCKEALERLMIAFNARMMLDNGMYWIYNPLAYANYADVTYNRYNTSGIAVQLAQTFGHALSISTVNTVRPKWAQFPTITHQPANREIKVTHEKYASHVEHRSQVNANSSIMTVGPLRTNSRDKIISEGIITVEIGSSPVPAGSGLSVQGVVVRARTYSFNAGVYRWYNQELNLWEVKSGKPGWAERKLNLPFWFYPSRFSGTKKQFPYNYEYDYDNAVDYVYTEFWVEQFYAIAGVSQYFYAPIDFWGVQRLMQKGESPYEQLFTNSNNTAASQVDNYNIELYDNYGLDSHGVVLVDNNAGDFVEASAWSAFPTATHTYVNDLISVNGYASMALYTNAVKSISGDWYDGGSYNVMKTLEFDESIWIWQGGTFNAQSEVFSGEWLRVASSFGLVVVGDEDVIDQNGSDNNQFKQGMIAMNERINLLYENNNTINEFFQYNVLYASELDFVNPVADQSVFNVGIKYDESNGLSWFTQELGKTQSLPGGVHDLDVTAELIICDSTEETVIVNLPDPATVKGRKYHFKKIASSHSVQLNGTIDTLPLYSFNGKDDCKVIMSDGTQYWLVAYYHK
jgi:hypothetical protein